MGSSTWFATRRLSRQLALEGIQCNVYVSGAARRHELMSTEVLVCTNIDPVVRNRTLQDHRTFVVGNPPELKQPEHFHRALSQFFVFVIEQARILAWSTTEQEQVASPQLFDGDRSQRLLPKLIDQVDWEARLNGRRVG